ncbi:hypothetical protein C7S16_5605 [Burkholderia thailandensis]|uniref:Uncharacterized protein n=1 Tax=Burkholderia thailandensis TaxID=57975 RepID=A0AAW9CWY6_BURTH|nr:hypothetical protein [Burkholderia thailandensis]
MRKTGREALPRRGRGARGAAKSGAQAAHENGRGAAPAIRADSFATAANPKCRARISIFSRLIQDI